MAALPLPSWKPMGMVYLPSFFEVEFSGYGPGVGHRAGQLGTAGVGGLALQHLSHSNRSVRGIHVLGVGAGDEGAGLIVGGDALGQLVRGSRCRRSGRA